MRIAVVGAGYVGLVTGTCFAAMGNRVVCVDNDGAKVERMRAGEVPIFEPQLEELFDRNVRENRLGFTTDLAEGITRAQVIFLALPTPPNEDGSADLSYVLQVADELGPLLKQYAVIVDKSTVPVGTAEKVRERIAAHTKVPFDVVSNPEFLREGLAVEDFMNPDRIVVGTQSKRARRLMHELYEPFMREGSPMLFMDERSAEITKYAANAFLSVKISFINEVANLCERAGADVDDVRMAVGADSRIGDKFLFPGIGYGGSCFPKDTKGFVYSASEFGYDFKVVNAAIQVNMAQQLVLVEKVKKYFKDNVKGKRFALWGLAFKPNTDDVREAPARVIIEALLEAGAHIVAFDPEAADNIRALYKDEKNLKLAADKYEALDGADALLIATEWQEFRSPDFALIREKLAAPVIFDGRNLYDPSMLATQGFYYESIGRTVAHPAETSQA